MKPLHGESGFALVAALWLLVVLSALGLEVSARSRDWRLTTANLAEEARVRAAAEGGIAEAQWVLERLLEPERRLGRGVRFDPTDLWSDLTVGRDTIRMGPARVMVRLADAGAALHLNRAEEGEIRGLLAALRVDFGDADRLAQRIMDWRDADDLHRARGAEREDYLRAGAAVLPANRPFSRLSELRHVAGMTPEIFDKVLPYLTLTGSGLVNLNSAPEPVLLALPGLGETAVRAIRDRRQAGRPIRSLGELSNLLPEGPRAALQAALPSLLRRVTFVTREVVATSIGRLDGSPVTVTVQTLFAQGGGRAFLIRSTVE